MMVVSLSVTVKANIRVLSTSAPLNTRLETVRSPVFRTLVKAATTSAAVMVPDAFSELVVKPSSAVCATVAVPGPSLSV